MDTLSKKSKQMNRALQLGVTKKIIHPKSDDGSKRVREAVGLPVSL